MNVHILHESGYSQNGIAFRFPLWFNRKQLEQRGMSLRFFSEIEPALFEGDVLAISSRFFSSWWSEERRPELFAFLEKAKTSFDRVIWFDLSDSTGTTQFQVLPFVHRYAKNQLLRDRTRYRERWYASRIFADYYHKQFNVEDDDPGPPHLNHPITDEGIEKLFVGWNSGLFHYGYAGLFLGKLWYRRRWIPARYPKCWHAPSAARSLPISCRVGAGHTRETIASSRRKIRELLKDRLPSGKIGRWPYLKELQSSIAAVSPFGLGEISLRDFECAVAGTAVIKQDMSHVDTWPNLWQKGRSYLPFAWDFSDFEEKIAYACDHAEEMAQLASCAQSRYRHILRSEEGQEEFIERFIRIVTT